ncbi:MAG: thioesterase family protein, partial [Actinobacteria bacterium]|nr:thioesterase family protein [Actinomycetota bacterium]
MSEAAAAIDPTSSRFDRDTAVAPSGRAGDYTAEISDGWSALGGMPNGGYVVAVALQALRAQVRHPDPMVVSAFFMKRAQPGPCLVRVEAAHGGRRHETAMARLIQGDNEILRATATFTDLARSRGVTIVRNQSPPLPPPEECVDVLGGHAMPGVTITERIEYRMPEVPSWLDGTPSGNTYAEFWMRFKDERPIDAVALVALVDAAAPVVVELGEGSSTVELTVHVRERPAHNAWVACRATTRHVINGYHEEDFEIWDA